MIERILENDWYKNATPAEMRYALIELELKAMDRLSDRLLANGDYTPKQTKSNLDHKAGLSNEQS